jgi:hypothetical protein
VALQHREQELPERKRTNLGNPGKVNPTTTTEQAVVRGPVLDPSLNPVPALVQEAAQKGQGKVAHPALRVAAPLGEQLPEALLQE